MHVISKVGVQAVATPKKTSRLSVATITKNNTPKGGSSSQKNISVLSTRSETRAGLLNLFLVMRDLSESDYRRLI